MLWGLSGLASWCRNAAVLPGAPPARLWPPAHWRHVPGPLEHPELPQPFWKPGRAISVRNSSPSDDNVESAGTPGVDRVCNARLRGALGCRAEERCVPASRTHGARMRCPRCPRRPVKSRGDPGTAPPLLMATRRGRQCGRACEEAAGAAARASSPLGCGGSGGAGGAGASVAGPELLCGGPGASNTNQLSTSELLLVGKEDNTRREGQAAAGGGRLPFLSGEGERRAPRGQPRCMGAAPSCLPCACRAGTP